MNIIIRMPKSVLPDGRCTCQLPIAQTIGSSGIIKTFSITYFNPAGAK